MFTNRLRISRHLAAMGLATFLIASCDQSPDIASARSELESQMEHGEVEKAVVLAKNLVQLDPRDAENRYLSAQAHRRAGLLEQAISEAERSVRLQPDQPEYVLEHGRSLFVAGRFADSSRLLSSLGDSLDAQVILGQIAWMTGQRDKARALLEAVLRHKTDHAGAHAALGWMVIEAGAPGADAHYAQITKAERDRPDARHLAALIAHANDDHATSNSLFNALTATEPFEHPVPIAVSYARSLLEQKDLKKAARVLEKYLMKRPGLVLARYYRALVAYQKRDYPMARQWIEPVTNSNPDHAFSRLLFGAIMVETGQNRVGELHIRAYVNQRPDDTAGRLLLAKLMMADGRTDDARELLVDAASARGSGNLSAMMKALDGALNIQEPTARAQALVTDNASSPDRLGTSIDDLIVNAPVPHETDRARLQTAIIIGHLQQRDVASAWKAVGEWKKAEPDAARPLSLAGVIHASLGNIEKAKAAFAQALEHDAHDVTAIINLADIDREAGDTTAAERRLLAFQQEHGSHPDVMLRLARLADMAGQHTRAGDLLADAYQATPEHTGVVLAYTLRQFLNGDHRGTFDAIETHLAGDDGGEAHLGKNLPLDIVRLATASAQIIQEHEKASRFLEHLKTSRPDEALTLYLSARQAVSEASLATAMTGFRAAYTHDQPVLAARIAEIRAYLATAETDAAATAINALAPAISPSSADEEPAFIHPEDRPTGWIVATLRSELALVQRQMVDAIAFAEEAYQLSGQEAEFLSLVQRLAQSGAYRDALQRMTQERDRFPESTRLGLLEAQLLQRLGQPTAALDRLQELYQRFPDHAIVANNLAFASLSSGETEAALAPAQRAFDIAGEEQDPIRDTYALALMHNGRTAEALTVLHDLVRRHPNDIDYRLHFVEALIHDGHRDAGRREITALERVLGEEHRQELDRLRRLLH